MKVVQLKDLKHEQLRSEKSGETFSLSAVVSNLLGSDQLFIHHDIIKPDSRSSGAHRHSEIEEVIYIVKGQATIVQENTETNVFAGAMIIFNPNDNKTHYIINLTNENIETMTFSVKLAFDETIFAESVIKNKPFPSSHFNEYLHSVPNNKEEWVLFIDELKLELKDEKNLNQKLSLFENIGIAAQILRRLGESEYYLNKAITLSYDHPRKFKLAQNLIRLAHVYQWQNQFTKAHLLFDQARSLIHQYDINESIKASYHQHLGKCYFDQKFYNLALTEFELALKMRQRLNSPTDQIESSLNAVSECKKRVNWSFSDDFIIRRAEVSDAESVHNAHM